MLWQQHLIKHSDFFVRGPAALVRYPSVFMFCFSSIVWLSSGTCVLQGTLLIGVRDAGDGCCIHREFQTASVSLLPPPICLPSCCRLHRPRVQGVFAIIEAKRRQLMWDLPGGPAAGTAAKFAISAGT